MSKPNIDLNAKAFRPSFSFSFFMPQYWGTWLLLGMMRVSVLLPMPVLVIIGKYFGRGLACLMKKRRRITLTNLQLCFPDYSAERIQSIARNSYENAGVSIFETALAWWASDKRIKALFSTRGLEHLEDALNKQEAVLLLSGHYSSMEIGGRLLSMVCDYQAMYKSAKNPLYNYFMHQGRSRQFKVINRKNTKTFIRNLKQGLPSWYAPDQNLKKEEHLFVDFFGVPTLTVTATSRIAGITKAKVIPYYPIRKGSRYEIIFGKAIEPFPSNDIELDTLRVNQAIEAGVKIDNTQYLWGHKRFDLLPDGSKRQYL